MTQNYPDADVFFAQGCPTADPGTNVLGFQKTPPKEEFDLQEALDTAVELAKKADKVVLTLGEHRDFSGEGASRADITLPSCQLELFHKICEVNPNVCVVLFNGRPLDIREINQKAKAILEAWLPGPKAAMRWPEFSTETHPPPEGSACPSPIVWGRFPYIITI